MPIQWKISLRFPMRMQEVLHPDPNMLVFAACYAIGSIDRLLTIGALVTSPGVVECLRWRLPKRIGGYLVGVAAKNQRDAIRRWGFATGGAGWKRNLADRANQVPSFTFFNDDEFPWPDA